MKSLNVEPSNTSVGILLSTYNGEKYLHQQLDSIFEQEGVSPLLLVRDDGSTDSTISILEDYSLKYSDRMFILKGKNIGWKQSFRQLASYAYHNLKEIDYFAFADQDDIWLPNKISQGVNSLKSYPDQPSLYFSNLFYYKDGENKGLIHKFTIQPNCKSALARNFATGCTVIFNRQLLKLFAKESPNINLPHDYWMYLLATTCGNVIYDPNSYILYRQHDSNQIGSKHGLLDVWKARIKRFKDPAFNYVRERTAKELLRIFSQDMLPSAKAAVEKLAYYKKTPVSRLKLFFDNGYTLNNFGNDFFFKLRIIFGRL